MKEIKTKDYNYKVYNGGSGALVINECCDCVSQYDNYIIEDGLHRHKIQYLQQAIKKKTKDLKRLEKVLNALKKIDVKKIPKTIIEEE